MSGFSFGASGGFGTTASQPQPQQQQQQQQQNTFGNFQSSNNNAPTQSNSTGFGFGQSNGLRPSPFAGFGQSQQNQQQSQPLLLGGVNANNSVQNATPQPSGNASLGPLWQPGTLQNAREKTIPEQMQTLVEKWHPEATNSLFQHYFYNTVQREVAPYFSPGPGEDERKWEDALSNKPDENSIPVLCKGFASLGNRLTIQVNSVTALQARLFQINESLKLVLQHHDLEIAVRAMDARRKHIALSQRSLRLATKVQLLRNRGYSMDSSEEALKQKLVELEKRTFDPQLNGQQEEIWARMVAVQERARYLKEETERAGAKLAEKQAAPLEEYVVNRVKKILHDYESEIAHLRKELDSVGQDVKSWESGDLKSTNKR